MIKGDEEFGRKSCATTDRAEDEEEEEEDEDVTLGEASWLVGGGFIAAAE